MNQTSQPFEQGMEAARQAWVAWSSQPFLSADVETIGRFWEQSFDLADDMVRSALRYQRDRTAKSCAALQELPGMPEAFCQLLDQMGQAARQLQEQRLEWWAQWAKQVRHAAPANLTDGQQLWVSYLEAVAPNRANGTAGAAAGNGAKRPPAAGKQA